MKALEIDLKQAEIGGNLTFGRGTRICLIL